MIKQEKISQIYEKYTIATLVICLLFIFQSTQLIVSIITFISAIVFFDEVNSKENRSYAIKNLVFGLLLYNMFVGIHTNIFNLVEYFSFNVDSSLISNLFIILIFIIMGFLYKDDKVKLNMSLFGIIVPIISLGATLDYEWLSIVLPSLFVYYITFNVCRLIMANTLKEVIGYIGYSISFLLVIFSSNYFVLGYSCVLLLLSLLVGYLSKKCNSLFRVAVISLIVLIIYQLKEFWTQIPAWLYLLLLGIALIGFATYKQLKMIDKDEQENKNNN